jgi:hypothetical protein
VTCCQTEAEHAARTESDYRLCAKYCGTDRHLSGCAIGVGGPEHTEVD